MTWRTGIEGIPKVLISIKLSKVIQPELLQLKMFILCMTLKSLHILFSHVIRFVVGFRYCSYNTEKVPIVVGALT